MGNRTIASLTTNLHLNNASFKKGLGNSKKELNKFSKSITAIGTSLAGVFSTAAILNFSKQSFLLAAQMEGVALAFERIKPSEGFMNDLKEATAGTVSELNLMKRSVMASNFKIPLTELATLLKFATKRAQETGESVDYLVNSIVIGIGRKSPLILDNLGISAVELRKKLDHVGHSGATVMDVAKAVGEIAQEEMAKAGDVVETTAIKFERLKAGIENAKVAFGKFLTGQTELDQKLRRFDDWLSKNLFYWFYYDANSEAGVMLELQNKLNKEIEKNPLLHAETLNKIEQYKDDMEDAADAAERQKKALESFGKSGFDFGIAQDFRKGAFDDIKFKGDAPKGVKMGSFKASGMFGMGFDIKDMVDKLFKEYSDAVDKSNARKDFIMHFEEVMGADLSAAFEAITDKGPNFQTSMEKNAERVEQLQAGFDGLSNALEDFGNDVEEIVEPAVDGLIEKFWQLEDRTAAQIIAQDAYVNAITSKYKSLEGKTYDQLKSMEKAGQVVAQFSGQFAQMGEVIAGALKGSADAIENLAKVVTDNLGSILISIGAAMGPAGLPFILLGAGLQLTGGIARGLRANDTPTALSSGNYYSTVNFKISGENLVGVMDRHTNKSSRYS